MYTLLIPCFSYTKEVLRFETESCCDIFEDILDSKLNTRNNNQVHVSKGVETVWCPHYISIELTSPALAKTIWIVVEWWQTTSQSSQDYDNSPDLEHNIVHNIDHKIVQYCLDTSQNITPIFDSIIIGTEDEEVAILWIP